MTNSPISSKVAKEEINIGIGSISRKSASLIFAFFVAGFGFSLWYLNAYFSGDQEHYANFYNSLYHMQIENWADLQRRNLGSSEPLYRYVIGVAAYFGIDRIIYLSIWNGLLISAISYALIKNKSSVIFSILLITNYYLVVIIGPAERLKFAYLFLIVAASIKSIRVRYILSIVSVFFHTQAIIQFISSGLNFIVKNRKKYLKSPLRSLIMASMMLATLTAAGFVFYSSMGEAITSKSAGYAEISGGAGEIIQWALLLVVGAYVFRDKLAYVAGMLPMGVFTFLYGSRVNVATFVFFAALAMSQRKTKNPIIILVMGYMSFKSFHFIQDVIRYGTGYP